MQHTDIIIPRIKLQKKLQREYDRIKTGMSKGWLALGDGVYQSTSKEQKRRIWLGQMSAMGGHVWDRGRTVVETMTMT